MRDKTKNEGRMRDDRTFNGGMQDKNILAGTRSAHFDRQDARYF